MKLRFIFAFLIIFSTVAVSASAQADTMVAQITASSSDTVTRGISADGRFVVFESMGNIATVNPRNSDGNMEIFLLDYAQRQIFQITDTKSVYLNPSASSMAFSNIHINIINKRPVISTDGRWIAFSSNATTSRPTAPNTTNPGSFDGNTFTTPTPTPTPGASPTPTPSPAPTPAYNPLQEDANMEIWLYQIPAYTTVDLRAGDEAAFVDLSGGTFTQATNTEASRLPIAGTASAFPFIADDNHDVAISDNGGVLAFTSTRDLVPCAPFGNPFPTEDNDEVYTYIPGGASICSGAGPGIRQITKTPRGTINNPIYNKNVSIAGNGTRLLFASTGENPVVGMTGGNNPETSRNEEIVVTDINANGEAVASTAKQVTVTSPLNPGDPVNVLDVGQRISRNGRYIVFDSYADLENENSGTNYTSFATYLVDLTPPATPGTSGPIVRLGGRSDADAQATGGDVARFPAFTDYDGSGNPGTIVLTMRLNIKSDGTVPSTAADGLNDIAGRPMQIYSLPLPTPVTLPSRPATTFTRLTKFPIPSSVFPRVAAMPAGTADRIAFSMAFTEIGTGNFDLNNEGFYLLNDNSPLQAPASVGFATGASRMPVSLTAVPSPTPVPTATPAATPTPTPTPTPSPTASPTGSPTPVPTPTPITPSGVQGISPGMLVIMTYNSGTSVPVVARTAVGSINRAPMLPLELSGISMSINGLACGIKSVSQHQIVFVVPQGIGSVLEGTKYKFVVKNNSVKFTGDVVIVPTRPDIFTNFPVAGPGGRAQAFNATNRVLTPEPFNTQTIRVRGGVMGPTVLRVRATGIANARAAVFSLRIGGSTVVGAVSNSLMVEPGVYTVDFRLPLSMTGTGDQPVILSITTSGTTFFSRLDDTASRTFIL